MTKQFWMGVAVATVVCFAGFAWQVASAQDGGPIEPQSAGARQAVCMRASMAWTKPAASAEEFMNEQIVAGRIRFVSLAMGDGAGLMCAW